MFSTVLDLSCKYTSSPVPLLVFILHSPLTLWCTQPRINLLITSKTKDQSGCHNHDHSAGGSSIKTQAPRQWEKKKKKRWLPPVCLNVILLQNNKTRGETVKKRGQPLEGFLPEIQNSSSPLITLIHYKSFPALLVPR